MSCCTDCVPIRANSTSAVTLTGLEDLDGNYVNNATVTYQLIDPEDDSVLASGSLAYQSNTNGNYRGSFTAPASLVSGKIYRVQSLAVAGDFQLIDAQDVICE